ncbi:putative lipid II flippase FtsW, partial [Zafaria sp. Z1313]
GARGAAAGRSPARPVGAPAAADRRTEPAGPVAGGTPPGRGAARLWGLLDGEGGTSQSSYYMILGSAVALTLIGLLMVLSSSSVEAISRASSSYGLFVRQGLFALAGLAMMFGMSRLPVRFLRKLAWPGLFTALLLLAAVAFTPLGKTVGGNTNWIVIGSFQGQPSEAAKLALAIWAAQILAVKGSAVLQTSHAIIPIVFPGGAAVIGLVLYGRDMGTALVLGLILMATLFLAGVRLRLFGIAAALGGAGALALLLFSGNRLGRINAWLNIDCESNAACYQPTQGIYALASGGWWGVGLGQSRQKWNYIPEAQNDFIVAVIGEELGLVGVLVIVVLFALLAVAMYRVAVRSGDVFVRVATGGIMAWLLGQAFVNIGMVTGLLPVIGIPLPFISYGGTALTLSLVAVGVVLSFARAQAKAEREAAADGTDPQEAHTA